MYPGTAGRPGRRSGSADRIQSRVSPASARPTISSSVRATGGDRRLSRAALPSARSRRVLPRALYGREFCGHRWRARSVGVDAVGHCPRRCRGWCRGSQRRRAHGNRSTRPIRASERARAPSLGHTPGDPNGNSRRASSTTASMSRRSPWSCLHGEPTQPSWPAGKTSTASTIVLCSAGHAA